MAKIPTSATIEFTVRFEERERLRAALAAIEAEARALALSELEEAVGRLWRERGWLSIEDSAAKQAVIQLIRDKQSEEER